MEDKDILKERFAKWWPDIYKSIQSTISKYMAVYGIEHLPDRVDFVQEIAVAGYLRMLSDKPPLMPIGFSELRAWCVKRTLWMLLNWSRRTRRRQRSVPLTNHRKLEGGGHESIEMAEIIEKLPERQKEAIVLRMDGYSYEEIAEKLGVEESTVRSSVRHARVRIANELAK